MFEEFGVEDRVAPRDAIRFATLCEFSRSVGTGGVEQPIVGRLVDDSRGYQGFCNQARDRVDGVRFVGLPLRRNGTGSLKREVPDKDRQPAQDQLLAL